GGHAFFGAAITIPCATLSTDIFGDNPLGEAVDFFNPISDAQSILDITQTLQEHFFPPSTPSSDGPKRSLQGFVFPSLCSFCSIQAPPSPPPKPKLKACVTTPGPNGPETECEP